MTSVREPSPRGRLKLVVRMIAVLIALGFMAALVSTQWQALQSFQWAFRPAWLIPSFALLALAWLLELSTWRFVLAGLGGRLRWSRAAQTWFLSTLVRYIPGNIWQFLGMAELAADDGVSRVSTFASIGVHQVLATLVGIVLAAVYFAAAGEGALLEAVRPLLWLAPLSLVLCSPPILRRSLNWLLGMLKRPPVDVTLTWGQVGLALLGYAGVWLLMGSGFALLAASITPISGAQFAALVATWAAAYVIGYLSMLTPSGLGVREGVMILLLAPLFPAPVPTVIALAARLWMVAGEVVGAAIALATRGRSRSVQAQQANATVTSPAGDS
jgi:glycosyltransferase 2 family protein